MKPQKNAIVNQEMARADHELSKQYPLLNTIKLLKTLFINYPLVIQYSCESPYVMVKSTISMAIFHSYATKYQRVMIINNSLLSQYYPLLNTIKNAVYQQPSGYLTQLWKITCFHEQIHYFYGHLYHSDSTNYQMVYPIKSHETQFSYGFPMVMSIYS